MSSLLRRFLFVMRWRRRNAELASELEFHRAMKQRQLEEQGQPPVTAAGTARRELGNALLAREQALDIWRWRWLDDLWRDLRHAQRALRRDLGFATIAIVTLGLGIAANAVVFAVLKTVVLSALPYGHADRLVALEEFDQHAVNPTTVSYLTAKDWLTRTDVFERLSLWQDGSVRIIQQGRTVQLRGVRVSVDFFDALGARMYLGRSFQAGDDRPNATNVLILTYETWVSVFGRDRTVVGRSIPTLFGPYLVAGVLSPSFYPLHMTNPAELPSVFIPFDVAQAAMDCRACTSWHAIGELAPGASARTAEIKLRVVMRQLAHEYRGSYAAEASVIVTPLHQHVVGTFGKALWLLQVAVMLLLLLACINVTTLMLARTLGRQQELALHEALGAGRWPLIRQMLFECAMLASTASLLAVLLAWTATRLVARTASANIPRIGELAPDVTILLLGIAACAMTTIAVGLVPAIVTTSRRNLRHRSSTPHRLHRTVMYGLIASELVMACVLVTLVGLLGKSYLTVTRVQPGFDAAHVMTVSLLPDGVHYPSAARRLMYFDAVAGRLSIPGVQQAGYASTLPLSHPQTRRVFIRENPIVRDGDTPAVDNYLISPDYLSAMRIPVVRGRSFTSADGPTAARVALISEAAARHLFANRDPIGAHVQLDQRDEQHQWAEIVGIVGDVHQYALDEPANAAIYLPFAQDPAQGYASLVIRSASRPKELAEQVAAAMAAVDPLQPIFHMQPMSTYVSLSVAQRSFTLAVVVVFGLLALGLSVGGVYGVVSYVVQQQTREIGIRLALGATRLGVGATLVRRFLAIAAIGTTVGLVSSAGITRELSSLLFGVSPSDPETLISVVAVLMTAALLAGAIPVLRASRVDPAVTLRGD